MYGSDGELEYTFGGRGSDFGQFLRPTGVTYDASRDRILIADKDNHRIQAFSSDGVFITSLGSQGHQPGRLHYPWGLAISPDGSLIAIGDSSNNRIQLFTAEGHFLRQFRIPEGAGYPDVRPEFDYPRGIAFSLDGKSSCFLCCFIFCSTLLVFVCLWP